MGQYKEKLHEQETKVIKKDIYLCAKHINDYAIKAEILKWSFPGLCSYCKKRRKVALYKDILPFIETGIYRLYSKLEDEALFYDSEDQKYFGVSPVDTEEMLYDAGLETDEKELMSDLINSFGNEPWCDKDPYADNENVELNYNWRAFKNVVKHKSRYVFLGSKQFNTGLNRTSIDEILHEVGRRVDALDLFSTIKKGTTLYRCRQHSHEEILTATKDFSSPPVKLAYHPNRMSPAGIPMFYCAFHRKTAQQETLYIADITRNRMSTAVFTPKQDLFVLNFSKLPQVPSIFDAKLAKHYFSILFLHQFVSDLSGPISKDGREHIEYVPTQIVTEYFRYTFEELTSIAIDGIIYPSSKNPGHDACVLFYDQKETLDNLDFIPEKLTIRKLTFTSL